MCVCVCVDTIDKWDTDKLSEVVEKKHSTKSKTKTDIVSSSGSAQNSMVVWVCHIYILLTAKCGDIQYTFI